MPYGKEKLAGVSRRNLSELHIGQVEGVDNKGFVDWDQEIWRIEEIPIAYHSKGTDPATETDGARRTDRKKGVSYRASQGGIFAE